MSDPISESARTAADLLSADFGPQLVGDVDAALQTREEPQRPEQFVDPISLGSLIVSVATLAWGIYTDLKTRTSKPSPEVVERTVRVQLRSSDSSEVATPEQRDRIVAVVVREIVSGADEES